MGRKGPSVGERGRRRVLCRGKGPWVSGRGRKRVLYNRATGDGHQTRIIQRVRTEADEEQTSSDNFRQMSIFPNQNDMNNFNPPLYDEEFPDLDAYIDTQFRLIKEDFNRPLRDDIREYKANSRKASKEVYHGVRILAGDKPFQV